MKGIVCGVLVAGALATSVCVSAARGELGRLSDDLTSGCLKGEESSVRILNSTPAIVEGNDKVNFDAIVASELEASFVSPDTALSAGNKLVARLAFVSASISELSTYQVMFSCQGDEFQATVFKDAAFEFTVYSSNLRTALQTTTEYVDLTNPAVEATDISIATRAAIKHQTGIVLAAMAHHARVARFGTIAEVPEAANTFVISSDPGAVTAGGSDGSVTPAAAIGGNNDNCDSRCREELQLDSFCSNPNLPASDAFVCCIERAQQSKCRRICELIQFGFPGGGIGPGIITNDLAAIPAAVDVAACAANVPFKFIHDLF